MNPTNNTGRLAGFLYILLGVFAPFSLLYVPKTLIVRSDAAATAANILRSETLFRVGMAGELVLTALFIVLVMVLYRLFNRTDRMQASLMAVFALLSVPISFIGVACELGALALLRGSAFAGAFTRPQLDAMALFFLGLHDKAILTNEIFWGLWLFPFGILVMRCGFLPRILGILLLINGATYVVLSLTGVLLPAYLPLLNRWAFIPETGELWVMLWLLIKGAKVEPVPQPAAA